MKKKLLICLMFISCCVFAQKKYEVFGIDDKFGIVDMQTGNEFMKPEYDNYKSFFIDFVDFETKTELILFDKMNGEKSIYKKIQDDSFYVRDLNSKMKESSLRLHIIENNKSKVVDSDNVKATLPKRYLKLESREDWLFGVSENNTIDIFNYKNLSDVFLTIKAPNFINSRIYKVDTKDYKSFYVFYSNVDISVYDDTFELAKSYKKGGRNQTEILNIIKDDFVYSKQLSQEMYEDIRSVSVDGYSVFYFDGLPVFKLKGNFEILKKDWRFIIIQDKITDKKYAFYIDFENNKISLPKDEQNKLDVQFLN